MMFKAGDVVRHKASGERFVVLERGSDGLRCDDGVTCHRWMDEICLEPAPPLSAGLSSRSAVESWVDPLAGTGDSGRVQVKDDKAWNLSKDDTSDRGYYRG